MILVTFRLIFTRLLIYNKFLNIQLTRIIKKSKIIVETLYCNNEERVQNYKP